MPEDTSLHGPAQKVKCFDKNVRTIRFSLVLFEFY